MVGMLGRIVVKARLFKEQCIIVHHQTVTTPSTREEYLLLKKYPEHWEANGISEQPSLLHMVTMFIKQGILPFRAPPSLEILG